MTTNPGTYTKAILTAVAGGVGPYIAAVQPTSQDGTAVSLGELLTIIGAVLVGSAAVWRADNVWWFGKAKAVASAVAQFLAQLSVLLLAGRAVTITDVLQALLAVGVTYGVVWVAPNAEASDFHDPYGTDGEDDPDEPEDPTQPDDAQQAEHADLQPLDEDGDGRDDKTGRFLPGHGLSMILGGNMAAAPTGVNLTAWPYGRTGSRLLHG